MTQGEFLKVDHLSVHLRSTQVPKELIHDVSFELGRGKIMVVLGESGSGKTIMSRSLTALFPLTSEIEIEGDVIFDGRRLHRLDPTELARIRQKEIRYVFQEPLQALNPLATVRAQMGFAFGRRDDAEFKRAFSAVGLENHDDVLGSYPHQLSTGMAQRVCIAMAMLPSPKLLVADEPTSAVDILLKRGILEMLMAIQKSHLLTLVLITHDLDIARSHGDSVLVMYAGRIVESGPRTAFFKGPLHPYSRLLLESALTKPGQSITQNVHLQTPDAVPESGCRFHKRCPIAQSRCVISEPQLEVTSDGRSVRCFYWK